MNRWSINEKYLLGPSVLLVIFTIVFSRFFLSPDWANSPEGLAFVDKMSQSYPGLMMMKETWPGYTPQIGVLFSLMAIGMPFHFLLGFLSGFFLPKERHENYLFKYRWRNMIIYSIYIFSASLWLFFHPEVLPPDHNPLALNQASDFLLTIIFSWLVVCTAIFLFGQLSGASILKFTLERNLFLK